MSDIQTSTIRVPKNVLEDIKIYCRKAGQPVGEWVERAWRFLQKNDFDIYDTEVTPSLPVPAEVERERNQVDVLCKLMSEFINSQKQAQLPAPDILQKTTNRVAELEHLIGKYQEKLDSLSEDKTMIIKERVEWERKYYDRDKQNYALLETLKKQGELLEKAKTELRHCKGFFSSANEDVLKELGISYTLNFKIIRQKK